MGPNRFIAYKALQNLILIYPVYPLLFRAGGLSLSQISLLLAIWSLPVLLLEIPSAVVADRWSRKHILVIAGLLRTFCFAIWMLPQRSFGVFALGFLFWGAGEALSSGAEEALLFDTLRETGSIHQFARAYGRGTGAASLATAVSCFAGGFAAQRAGYTVVLSLCVLCSLAATLIVCGGSDVLTGKPGTEGPSDQDKGTLKPAVQELMTRRVLLSIAAFLVFPVILGGILDEFDPLIASSYVHSASLVGLWIGVRYLLESLGSFSASFLHRRSEHISHMLCLCGGLGLLIYSLVPSIPLLPLYIIFFPLLAAAGVIQEHLLQQHIEDAGRSTVHSLISLAGEMHAVLLFFLLGFHEDLNAILRSIALYELILVLLFIGVSRRYSR